MTLQEATGIMAVCVAEASTAIANVQPVDRNYSGFFVKSTEKD